MADEKPIHQSQVQRLFQLVLRRTVTSLLILLAIAFLTLFGLYLAQLGKQGLPATAAGATLAAVQHLFDYLFHHPQTYIWHKESVPALKVISSLFLNSAGLLMVSLVFAGFLGVTLGILAALWRRGNFAPLMLLVSILGISTPSFLLAMLFWIVNIKVYNLIGTVKAPLPPTGFGWDLHLVMPALVLSARPLAQIMQMTYVSMSEAIGQDYMRAAKARGAPRYLMVIAHALPNILIPILTTLGTSLRFSLASLPVVESFFLWPGIGLALLESIGAQTDSLVTDLVVSLGLLFLLINLFLEFLYPLIDPRLRADAQNGEHADDISWGSQLESIREFLSAWGADVKGWAASIYRRLVPQAARAAMLMQGEAAMPLPGALAVDSDLLQGVTLSSEVPFASSSKRILTSATRNLPLMLGTVMVLVLILLAVFGSRLTANNPYQTNGVMMINKEIAAPPFEPSSMFPWGSDIIGRDVQALVLWGARQTLALAFFGMVARMILGITLGLLAGWWQNSWLDRAIQAVISVWAAFPITLFAMIMILALGIQKGMSVFIITLCVIGWGEIAQYARGQVITQKPELYVEAARSVGVRSTRILIKHILPHLLPSILVLSALEMGGILMLLAELGFLNIFLGGGFKVEIGDTGRSGTVYFFSDTPEWGAMLSNIRNFWRSNPWLAWYPGLFFFLSILSFNVWGEGMRRFMEESKLNLGRLVNRYTVIAALVLVVGTGWLLRSNSPIETYRPVAKTFNAERAITDIARLSTVDLEGRESGKPGSLAAAKYIAQQMKDIGLFPAGDTNDTFIQSYKQPLFHMSEVPILEVLDSSGSVQEALVYRKDFTEYGGSSPIYGEVTGQVVGLAAGPAASSDARDRIIVSSVDLQDKVILIREQDLPKVTISRLAGLIVIAEDDAFLERRYLPPSIFGYNRIYFPIAWVTPEMGDTLLQTAGSSLDQIEKIENGLKLGQAAVTAGGTAVHLKIAAGKEDLTEEHYNVIGYLTGESSVEGLDSQVIMVSAYYDGLGTGPDGTFYPGANDNASGVASMLEVARILKESPYFPKKTIVFVAWSDGEWRNGLSVKNVMSAKTGFNHLTVEAVLELSGMGGGAGKGVALGQGSSFRLVTLFQDAGSRLGVRTTTRGRGPHFDIPSQIGFGGRSALSAYLSWDGSDDLAHTPFDTLENIDPDKLRKSGQLVTLVTSMLSREKEY